MNTTINEVNENDGEEFFYSSEVSDEALEAAAGAGVKLAVTNSPTYLKSISLCCAC